MVNFNNPSIVSDNINQTKEVYKPCVDLSSPLLDENRRDILTKLTIEYSDCFVNPENNELGLTKLASHKIDLKPDAKSVHKNPYRQPHHVHEEMDKTVEPGFN